MYRSPFHRRQGNQPNDQGRMYSEGRGLEGRERMKEGIATHTEISDPGRGKHQEWAGLLFGFLLNLKIIDAETLPLASQGL